MAVGKAPMVPERDPKNLAQTLALGVAVDCIIEGTARRLQRPHETIEQKEK